MNAKNTSVATVDHALVPRKRASQQYSYLKIQLFSKQSHQVMVSYMTQQHYNLSG